MAKISEVQRKTLLKEYEIGEQLRESYFKNSWVVTSIILPVSFGLIGVSYTERLLELNFRGLVPLLLASVTLYAFWYFYIDRYAGYLNTVYKRLQSIEELLGMALHRNIDSADKKKGRLRTLNNATGGLLIAIWLFRLAYAGLA